MKRRSVKSFVASSEKGERDPEKAEEQIAVALECSLTNWIQAMDHIYNLTINHMEAVRLWNSVMVFVDYTVSSRHDTVQRMREFMDRYGAGANANADA